MKKTIAQELNITDFPFEITNVKGNLIYKEWEDGEWSRWERDSKGKKIYYEDSDGFWAKWEYDYQGNEIYFENSDGKIIDKRPKPEKEPMTINLEITRKFRKKPIEIHAVQFTIQNKDEIYNWAKCIQQNVFHSFDENKKPSLKIPTLEGEMECLVGDYLIVEPFPTDWRKLYPCKKPIFEQAYELVS